MRSPIVILILLVFSLLMFGCQSKKQDLYKNESPSGAVELLNCNKFTGSSLRGKVETDVSSLDYVYLKFTSNPSNFSDSGVKLGFYAGTDVSSISGTSLGFLVFDTLTGLPISNFNNAGQFVDQDFLNSLTTNPPLTLSKVYFHVQVGPLTRVLRLRLTKSVPNQPTQVLEQKDILIPSFDANPNTYALNHTISLTNLHPLLPWKNESWTSAQYKQMGDYLCTQP